MIYPGRKAAPYAVLQHLGATLAFLTSFLVTAPRPTASSYLLRGSLYAISYASRATSFRPCGDATVSAKTADR